MDDNARLWRLIAIDVLCTLVAVAAILGAFRTGSTPLYFVFGAALAAGLVAQVWYVAGSGRAKGRV